MDLTSFCSLDREMPTFSKPFSHGDFTYASDGRMIIRVPRIPEISSAKPDALKLEKLGFPADGECVTEFPEYEALERHKCPICKGYGKVEECPECDGEGSVEFDNGYHMYSADCKSCGGRGAVSGGNEKCSNCNGTGRSYADGWAHVDIGDVRLSARLLDKIKDLPNVKLGPVDGAERKMVAFSFDGGDGVLMGMVK